MKRLPTVVAALVIGSAGIYAACSKSTPEPEKAVDAPAAPQQQQQQAMPPGHPPVGAALEAPSPHAMPPGHPPVGGNAAAAAPAGPDDVAWDAPAAWKSVPNANAMRKATYMIPKVAGDDEDAELTISAAGGGVDANIQRWAGQFGGSEAKTERLQPNGLDVTVVEIAGTYASGGMMGGPTVPKEKFMLLGAVVNGADRQHFFKMTGPEKTVRAAKKDFDAFVMTFRAQ